MRHNGADEQYLTAEVDLRDESVIIAGPDCQSIRCDTNPTLERVIGAVIITMPTTINDQHTKSESIISIKPSKAASDRPSITAARFRSAMLRPSPEFQLARNPRTGSPPCAAH